MRKYSLTWAAISLLAFCLPALSASSKVSHGAPPSTIASHSAVAAEPDTVAVDDAEVDGAGVAMEYVA